MVEQENQLKATAKKKDRLKNLAGKPESARRTTLLGAADELDQIASNFEDWKKKEQDRFRRGVLPADVEKWISNHFSDNWIACLFNYPVPRQPDGLFPNESKKEFRLIIDTFQLYLPNVARSLAELYNMFLQGIKFHVKMYEREKREEVPLLSAPCVNFLKTTVTETIRRLRYIAQLTRESLAEETNQKEIVEVKPGVYGITVDIKELARRVWKCVCSRRKEKSRR